MGGSESKVKNLETIVIDHPMFKQAKINVENNVKTLQTTIGADQTSYYQWSKILKTQNLRSQFLLLPIKHHYQSKGLCGSSGTLTLNYENYPHILSSQIIDRKNKNIKFKETQLWLLLYSLVAAKRDFSFYSQKVGDIRPRNIFLRDDSNKITLANGDIFPKDNIKIIVANGLSWPNEETNTVKSFNQEITYIAPQQIEDLHKGIYTKKQQIHDPQIFTIGLTLLSAGLLVQMNQIYDLKAMKFNQKVHYQNLEDWKRKSYSEILRGTILNLCQVEADKRVAADQFTNWIEKYHQSIKVLQNFTVTDAPIKIHNQIQEMRQIVSQSIYKTPLQQNPTIDFLNSSKGPKLTQAESIYTPLPSSLYTQGSNTKNFRFTYNEQQRVSQPEVSKIIERKQSPQKQK